MISEEQFKENLIYNLNRIRLGWIDGDKQNHNNKTADIVNHRAKIAIEIKDDTKYKTELPTVPGVIIGQGCDLTKMNQRYSDHVKSANNKFKQYPSYKTILIFRTEFIITDIIRYAIEGLHSYQISGNGLVYIGRRGKYSHFSKNEIGCFLIINGSDFGYFPNQLAKENRIISKDEAETIFGHKFNDISIR